MFLCLDACVARSVWQEFEIHVTNQRNAEYDLDSKQLISSKNVSELLLRATAPLSGTARPVSMSEDFRIFGLTDRDNPTCVVIKTSKQGQILHRLMHKEDETVQLIDLVPDGRLTVVCVRNTRGECSIVI